MCEVILSAIISFFVDAIGNFFFSKFLNNNIDQQKALNSKIININKTNNRLDHNQINQNTMDNNIIGNNNSIFNYNQNIQVTNNLNITANHTNKTSDNIDPFVMIFFYLALTIIVALGFFWLKRTVSHYTLICFLIFLIGLNINRFFSYTAIKTHNYLFLEKDKYIIFLTVLFLIMILLQSNVFVPKKFLQIETMLNNEQNFEIIRDQLASSLSFTFYYAIKNVLQIIFILIPFIDIIVTIPKKKIPFLIRMNANNFITCCACFIFIYFITIMIFYFN